MVNKYKTRALSTWGQNRSRLHGSIISLVNVSNKRTPLNLNGLTYRIRIVFIRETTLGIGYLRYNPYHYPLAIQNNSNSQNWCQPGIPNRWFDTPNLHTLIIQQHVPSWDERHFLCKNVAKLSDLLGIWNSKRRCISWNIFKWLHFWPSDKYENESTKNSFKNPQKGSLDIGFYQIKIPFLEITKKP